MSETAIENFPVTPVSILRRVQQVCVENWISLLKMPEGIAGDELNVTAASDMMSTMIRETSCHRAILDME